MGSWCQKSLLKSFFCFNFLSSIYKKKVTKPYKSIFTSISRVFRVNQVFFSSWGPPFLHKLQILQPTHSRSQNAEHTSCDVSIFVSPSNEARNARTQRRNEMHSMAAVNEQKIHAMLSRERLITFLICLLILYLLKYIYIYTPFKSTFESLPGV